MKDRGTIRYERYRHIERKKRIIDDLGGYWHYEHEGTLSKGKIHCSCQLCRMKTNNGGSKKSKLSPVHNPKISEARKEMLMDLSLEEYLDEEI